MRYVNAVATVVFLAVIWLMLFDRNVTFSWGWIYVVVTLVFLGIDFLRKKHTRKIDATICLVWMAIWWIWAFIGVFANIYPSLANSNIILTCLLILLLSAGLINLFHAVIMFFPVHSKTKI